MTGANLINQDLVDHHQFLYLTTTGRRSGRPHRIEIWYTVDKHQFFIISGGGTESDWVQNLIAYPNVVVEVGEHRWEAIASMHTDPAHEARGLLAGRYQGWTPDQPLTDWASDGLVIQLTPEALKV